LWDTNAGNDSGRTNRSWSNANLDCIDTSIDQRLRASAGRLRIETLAAEVGWSRRHLHARFQEQIGLSPKTAARLMRFEHVCRRLDRHPARWVEIAYDAGYSDQSHLNRDFRDLAGTTPTEFVSRRIPGGGVVGDHIPFVQD